MNTSRAVVVASAYRGDTPSAGWVEVVARRSAAAINELGGPRPREIRFDPDTDPRRLSGSWCGGSSVGAVVLLGAAPEHAARIQAEVAARGGPVVVTDHDAAAITLVAAALTSLSYHRRRTDSAHVVIAGANRLPGVGELLVAAAVGEVTLWNLRDALGFPLSLVAADADVVINLLEPVAGGGRSLPAVCSAHTGPVVLAPDPARDVPLVLPGLAHALGVSPGARLTASVTDRGGLELTYHEICHTCALELVMATPPGHRRLPTPSTHLSTRIADAVARSLPRHSPQPGPADASVPLPGHGTTSETHGGESP